MKIVGLTLITVAILAFSLVFYYFYSSDCCISPICTECLFEGEIPCECDEYVESKQFDKVCDECHESFCGSSEEMCLSNI